MISPLIKNDYWVDEGETRLVFYRPVISDELSNVKKDVKGRNYVEYEIPQNLIEEVIIAQLNSNTIEEVQSDLKAEVYDISKISVKDSKGKGVVKERGK